MSKVNAFEPANELLEEISGIKLFFNNEQELIELRNKIEEDISIVEEPNRRAYGDFQTNEDLASKVTTYLYKTGIAPSFIIEPTCGKGTFILAAIQQFETIKKVVGIEIYYPYVWETKFSILELFLNKKPACKPAIEIIHQDIFNFDLDGLARENKHLNTLIIGNPPWVTNSELSTLNATNLPQKSNFKNHKGIDAITGKGNFDIGEYISLQILRNCLLYTSPSPRDGLLSRMPSSA